LQAVRSDDNIQGFEDIALGKIARSFRIEPLRFKNIEFGPKESLGAALFFDPILSGPRNISCAACHSRSLASGDGLSLAVGIGAEGVGKKREDQKDALVVARNTLPLFNRNRREFKSFFWDGRVQLGPLGNFESPLGQKLEGGFENLLAVASVFPLSVEDEMLGRPEETDVNSKYYHGALIKDDENDNNYQLTTLDVFLSIGKRIWGKQEEKVNKTQKEYRVMFSEAYPNVSIDELNISHVGNALSAYISAAFNLQPSPWDRYIDGDRAALSLEQKKGAILFYGKARCTVCHSGNEFSDFSFHGLSIPQQKIGKHGSYLDYGRAVATGLPEFRYMFRTPPLRNVEDTGPWGHNGIFKSVKEAIEHHVNPIPLLYKSQQIDPTEKMYVGNLIGYRSPILAEIAPLTSQEIDLLVKFLSSLSSLTVIDDNTATPMSVPSGDNSFITIK